MAAALASDPCRQCTRREEWWELTQSPAFDADPIRLFSIEFVGGPYDGHFQTYYTCARLLATEVTCRVGPDVFQRLHEFDHDLNCGPHQSVTSVALYQRETANETYRYCFVAAVSVKQLTDSIRDHEER